MTKESGTLELDEVRFVEVTNALVDTGVTMLSMPKRLIEQLGLTYFRTRRARTSGGPVEMRVYGAVCLTVQGRDCISDVSELPEHGGEHMIEMY